MSASIRVQTLAAENLSFLSDSAAGGTQAYHGDLAPLAAWQLELASSLSYLLGRRG